MTRPIGGFSLEGRYFIVQVPEGWTEMDPLPEASPDDLWFDRVSDFKAALHGPWIRRPVRRSVWKKTRRVAIKPPIDRSPAIEEHRLPSSIAPSRACSRSLDDLTESDGGRREIAFRLGRQVDA